MTPTLINSYLDYQRQRGFTKATLKRRALTLRLFAAHIAPTQIRAATGEMVDDFLRGYPNPRTRHAYASDLRAFYRWAHRRQLVSADPCELVDPVKVPRSLPRPIPAALVPGLVVAARDDDLRLMVALAAYAGLRRAEIAALDAADVGCDRLTVRGGKGGKDRVVPLHPVLRRLLDGRRGPLFACGADTVGRRIRDHLHDCGVNATAHQLRHTFATELYRVSHDLLVVSALLGHESPTTTAGYTALGGDRGAAAVAHLFDAA